MLVVKHRPGKGGLYSPWSYGPGEGLARPNDWNGAVSQEDGVILPWVDLRTQNFLVCQTLEKRNLSCEPDCRKVADWRFLRELSIDAECFRRTSWEARIEKVI